MTANTFVLLGGLHQDAQERTSCVRRQLRRLVRQLHEDAHAFRPGRGWSLAAADALTPARKLLPPGSVVCRVLCLAHLGLSQPERIALTDRASRGRRFFSHLAPRRGPAGPALGHRAGRAGKPARTPGQASRPLTRHDPGHRPNNRRTAVLPARSGGSAPCHCSGLGLGPLAARPGAWDYAAWWSRSASSRARCQG